jgi:DNA-binding Lrp family transcriptional regulator
LQNIGPEELQKMREDLLANEKAFWIIEMQGNFDLFFATWCKSLTEFRKFADDFMIKYSRYVKVKTENIATDVIHYQHRYLLGKKDTMELHVAETDKRVEIDELDKKILRLLCENARISLVDIGQKLKEHPKTIAYRISRLEKIKLIEAYRISIDHTKLGYTYYKIFLNISNYHNEEIKRLKEFIKRNPATIYIVEGIGLHADLDFEMMIKDNKELFDFIKELRKEFPKIIENYNTVIFMETLKVRYLPF